jgi:hypothetical protein
MSTQLWSFYSLGKIPQCPLKGGKARGPRFITLKAVQREKPLQVYDDGMLIKLLCTWTVPIVLFYPKHTTFRRLVLSPSAGGTYSVGSIERPSPYLWSSPETGTHTVGWDQLIEFHLKMESEPVSEILHFK